MQDSRFEPSTLPCLAKGSLELDREKVNRHWLDIPLEKKAAVGVIFVSSENSESCSLILTQRSQMVATHKGQFSFPGGRAEASEKSPEETALREVEEEILLSPHDIQVQGVLKPLPSFWGLTVWPVVMTAFLSNYSLKTSPEVERILYPNWFEFEGTKAQSFRMKVGGTFGSSPFFTVKQAFVWGLTAKIIDQAKLHKAPNQHS